MIFDLVRDFADLLDVMPKEHARRRIIKLLDEAIRRDAHFIERHPTTMFQCLCNTCSWHSTPLRKLVENWRADRNHMPQPWILCKRAPPWQLGGGATSLLVGQDPSIRAVTFAQSNAEVATGSSSGSIFIWDCATSKAIGKIEPAQYEDGKGAHRMPEGIAALYWVNRDQQLLAVSDGGTIQIFERSTLELISKTPSFRDTRCAVMSDHRGYLATGSMDGKLLFIDYLTRKSKELAQYSSRVQGLAFLPSSDFLISGTSAGEISIWNVADGVELKIHSIQRDPTAELGARGLHPGGPRNGVNCLVHLPRSRTIAVGLLDSTIRIIDLLDGEIRRLRGHRSAVTSLATDPAGTFLVSGSFDGEVCKWNVDTWDPPQRFSRGGEIGVLGIDVSPRDSSIACGYADGRTAVWRTPENQGSVTPMRTSEPILSACYSPDHRWLLSAAGTSIDLWDAATGEHCWNATCEGVPITAAFSLDGTQIITQVFSTANLLGQTKPRRISIWNRETGKLVGAREVPVGATPPPIYEEEKQGYSVVLQNDGSEIYDSKHRLVAWFPDLINLLAQTQFGSQVQFAACGARHRSATESHLYILSLMCEPRE